jgi:hypothetical protein
MANNVYSNITKQIREANEAYLKHMGLKNPFGTTPKIKTASAVCISTQKHIQHNIMTCNFFSY